MGRSLYLLFLLVVFNTHVKAQSYGLGFNSHESVAEKRTLLDLSPDDSICFSHHQLTVDFEINFSPNYSIYFGYILRLINSNQNIDLLFDERTHTFKIITGNHFSGISFAIAPPDLNNEWNKISLVVQPEQHKLTVIVNTKTVGTADIQLDGGCYRFLWGANDLQRYYTRDIPPMRIRDIRLSDEKGLKYFWPLNETSGNISFDEIQHRKAVIKNPVWIKPKHQQFSLMGEFAVHGIATVAFDNKTDRLFITGADSVMTYDLKNNQNPVIKTPVIAKQYKDIVAGSQSVFDTITGQLYTVFIDNKRIATYRFGEKTWGGSMDSMLTEYWHPNKFISSFDSSLYIIGGYGQYKYKNTVLRYYPATGKWDTVKTSGDFFPPRYLAALGVNPASDTAYILGGYGSPTGDQMLDPGNYYDMYAFDVKTKSFKKLFTLDSVDSKFTFANSLIIDAKKQEYYGLIFPNDSFNSSLHLIRGSLKDSSYQVVGSPISYPFYDLQSFADLYYSRATQKFIVVTLSYSKMESKNKFTTVKLYSIDFPPFIADNPVENSNVGSRPIIITIAIFIAIALSIIVLRRKKALTVIEEKKSGSEPFVPVIVEAAAAEEEEDVYTQPVSQILLFGPFQVLDMEGGDISRLFTPVIKELFLLILIHTMRNEKGISSEEISEILWSDKSGKDAKNNRSVNIAKLKSILEKVGNCTLSKDSGLWQFQETDESVYVDFREFNNLVKKKPLVSESYVHALLKIAGRGQFLPLTEYSWLDDIKSGISNSVINICLDLLQNQKPANDEFIIEITNCIFHFDALNEDALEFKCRSFIHLRRYALAKNTYTKFVKDYKEIYGEEFGKSFNDIIKDISDSTNLPSYLNT